MVRRQFSIDEAEALLPVISSTVRRLQTCKKRLERYEQVTLQQRIMTDGSEEDIGLDGEFFDSDHQALKESLYKMVDKLCEHGCILRDIDLGAVDFYTLFEGREVYLSWQLGEESINHWYELDESHANRKPVIRF